MNESADLANYVWEPLQWALTPVITLMFIGATLVVLRGIVKIFVALLVMRPRRKPNHDRILGFKIESLVGTAKWSVHTTTSGGMTTDNFRLVLRHYWQNIRWWATNRSADDFQGLLEIAKTGERGALARAEMFRRYAVTGLNPDSPKDMEKPEAKAIVREAMSLHHASSNSFGDVIRFLDMLHESWQHPALQEAAKCVERARDAIAGDLNEEP